MTGAPPTPGEPAPILTARRLVHVGAGATFALAALMAPILWVRIAAVAFALGFALLDALRLTRTPGSTGASDPGCARSSRRKSRR